MYYFNIIAGIASISSFIISLWTLNKVNKIEKTMIISNSDGSKTETTITTHGDTRDITGRDKYVR